MKRIVVGLVALAIIYVLYSWLKPKKDDREYLLGLPSMAAGLVEKRQTAEVKRLISPRYFDKKGRDFAELGRILLAHTLQGGEISIHTLNPGVELDEAKTRATLTFKAAMTRGAKDPGALDVIPASASLYDFTLFIEKTSDGWLVMSGDWVRALRSDSFSRNQRRSGRNKS